MVVTIERAVEATVQLPLRQYGVTVSQEAREKSR
jgi:hypothetical protein